MNGRPGACVPETMRFNGQGIEYESSWDSTRGQKFAYNCAAEFTPYYNARTLSTGAEVSLWIWRQYLATDDRPFLAANYPVMAASARFLLSYQQLGPDGLLHTSPSNAHENQWDVTDPTTDIAAAAALYPVTIQAAQLLGRDSDLVQLLQAALPKIPPLPRTQLTRPFTLLPSAADAAGADMIAESYLSDARNHNGENTGLIRIAPAVPPGWDVNGSVYVQGKTKVDVQVTHGEATTVVIESGIAHPRKFRNPWPGQAIDVVDGKTGQKLVDGSIAPTIAFKAAAGTNYLVERQASPTSNQPFAPLSGTPATSAKKLGPVQLGLFPASQ